jgi:hypothetical protein
MRSRYLLLRLLHKAKQYIRTISAASLNCGVGLYEVNASDSRRHGFVVVFHSPLTKSCLA